MDFLYLLEDLRTPFFDRFFALITWLGSEYLFIVVGLIVYWCVGKQKGYYLLTVGFTGILLNQVLKLLCMTPRPWLRDPGFTIVEAARAEATGYSFPSGHTQSAACLYGGLARSTGRRWLRITAAAALILTAFSRLYLGVHTPADVLMSLAIGAALVFGLYPLFRGEPKSGALYAVFGLMTVLAAGFVLFTELYPWPADIDAVNLREGLRNAWYMLGASAGVLVSYFLDRRYVNFSTKAPLLGQILKVVLGTAIVLALKELLKAPLAALIGELPGAALRYFIVVVFAMAVWPLSFKHLEKLGQKG